jgi:hypothetical protein
MEQLTEKTESDVDYSTPVAPVEMKTCWRK